MYTLLWVINMNIGEKIKQLRKSNHMSQEELAEKLGVSRQSVSQWEQNATQPSLDNLIAISKEFNVSVDDITRDDIEEQDKPKVAFWPATQLSYDPKQYKKIRILSVILIILNITAAEFVRNNLSDNDVPAISTAFWISLALLVIPIGTIVFDMLVKKKGYRGKAVLIFGIVSLVYILIVLFTILSSHFIMQDKGYPEIKQNVENTINIELPDETNTVQNVYNNSDLGKETIVTFTDSQVKEFEEGLASSNKWCKPLSTKNTSLLPMMAFNSEDNYSIIYNVTLNELNTFPKETSTYHFYYLEYNEDNNSLHVYEYNKKIII